MLCIDALPAGDGDCLWIEWPDEYGMTHRMLVDGGHGRPRQLPPALAGRLARQPEDQRTFDLVVCTHIDADHIGGLLTLIDDPPPGFQAADFWFNGRPHLDMLSPAQGDVLSLALGRGWAPWNQAFDRAAVVITPAGHDLPVIELPGLRITLLSPTRAQLARLAHSWPQVLAEAETGLAIVPRPPDLLRRDAADRLAELHELTARPYTPDRSVTNASSIAFLAETSAGERVLLAADATAELLAASLRRLADGGRYRVDLCKVPHHGSRHNTSRELLTLLDCQHWLISTNGQRHGHPNREAMARILCRPDEAAVWFNYRGETTEEYASPALSARYGFTAMYPALAAGQGIAVRLDSGRVELAGVSGEER